MTTRTAPATRPYRVTVLYRSTSGRTETQSRISYASLEAAQRASEAAIARGRSSCSWRAASIVDARTGDTVASARTDA